VKIVNDVRAQGGIKPAPVSDSYRPLSAQARAVVRETPRTRQPHRPRLRPAPSGRLIGQCLLKLDERRGAPDPEIVGG
jgi:hypothetical protein